MYEPDIAPVATRTAGTLGNAITSWSASRMSTQVLQFPRHAKLGERGVIVQDVHEPAAQLDSLAKDARFCTEAWVERIAQYLLCYRDTLSNIETLLEPTAPGAKFLPQDNVGTGGFISENINGGIINTGGGD
jgi:hypothetical protein